MTDEIETMDSEFGDLSDVWIPYDPKILGNILLGAYSREQLVELHDLICFALCPAPPQIN